MKKKILCIVLSISMLAVFMPSVAFAVTMSAVPVGNFDQLVGVMTEYSGSDLSIALTNNIDVDVDEVSGPVVFPISDSNLSIDLNGYTINCNGKQLFALLGNSELTLRDGTITNGATELGGGAIFVDQDAFLYLEDITIKDCFANHSGGAINLYGHMQLSGKVTIEDNTAFNDAPYPKESNVAVMGGDISVHNLSTKSNVGITCVDGTFANVSSERYAKCFFGDSVCLDFYEEMAGYADFKGVGIGYQWMMPEVGYQLYVGPDYLVAVNNARVDLYDKVNAEVEKNPTKINKMILEYNTRVMDEIQSCGTAEKVAELVAKAKAQDAVIAAGGTGAAVAALAAYNYIDKAFVVPYQESLKKLNDYAKDGNLIAQETINNLDSSLKDSVLKGFGVTPTTGEVVVAVIAKVAKEIVAYNTDMVAMNTALQQIQGQEAVKFTFQAIGRVVYSVREGVYEFFRTIFNKPAKA